MELYNSGKTLAELNSEYGVAKSTITGWVKKSKPVAVDKDTTIASADYQAMLKKRAKLEEENEKFKIYNESKKRYGAPKIHKILTAEGFKISLKRVQRIMKKLGIKSIVVRKYRPYSSKKKVEEKENILNRDFSASTINQKWATDITYIYTIRHGWCYLASVMDLCTKKIIGYSFSKNIDTEMSISAVANAIKARKPTTKVILHSDLGSQYTSAKFKEFVDKNKIIHSFSGKGNIKGSYGTLYCRCS